MKPLFFLAFLVFYQLNHAQTLQGTFAQNTNQEISLTGFNYFKTEALAKTTANQQGKFTLNYPKAYKGMALLKTQDNSNLVFVLAEPNIHIQATHLQQRENLQFTNSTENTNFVNYATQQASTSNALSAWGYLEQLYNKPPLQKETTVLANIAKEINRLHNKDQQFINSLPNTSYVKWFIPLRKLVQNMPQLVKNNKAGIPKVITQFRAIDFTHPNFKTSGVFKELIEGHFYMIQQMGTTPQEKNTTINKSVHYLVNNLNTNEELLKEVTEHLLKFFEQSKLSVPAAYLADIILQENKCILDEDLTQTLKKYEVIKIGATAPDIVLNNNTKLSDSKQKTLLIFGASWCPTCKQEYKALLQNYNSIKAKGIEVVYISIDTDKKAFEGAYKNAPFTTHCDFKGWDTQAAKDYYINATPTYILLDKDLKIEALPQSIQQIQQELETNN